MLGKLDGATGLPEVGALLALLTAGGRGEDKGEDAFWPKPNHHTTENSPTTAMIPPTKTQVLMASEEEEEE